MRARWRREWRDGGLSAFSLLRSAGLEQGQTILVYGASGSIGVGGVQVAKHLGAHVTAVCQGRNVDLMRSLGADDVVFDAAGKISYARCRRSVKPDGLYITTDPGFLWRDAARALVSKRASSGSSATRRQTS